MDGKDLRRIRERNEWTQAQLSDLLKATFDGKYSGTQVGRWEKGTSKIPDSVASFLVELEIGEGFGVDFGADAGVEPGSDAREDPVSDSAPPPPPDAGIGNIGALLPSGGIYARVCEEMWELVATGIGMAGAVTGSETLQADGRIILEDKQALGKAYGKLAETNETFRRMLTGMTSSGAWLEVALVSGITAGKLMRNHQSARQQDRQQPQDDFEVATEDGRVVPFAAEA